MLLHSRVYSLNAIALGLLILISSCEKGEVENERVSPSLPPYFGFLKEFGLFDLSENSVDTNYRFAQESVAEWNSFLTDGMESPIESWSEVREDLPTWDENEEAWIWYAEFNDTKGNYSAALHGWKDKKELKWRMYFDHQGIYKDFLWYTGTTRVDSTYGKWRVYQNEIYDNPYIDIQWWNSADTDNDTIMFEKVRPNDVRAGSTFRFGRFENIKEESEVFITMYDALDNANIEIWMNEETGEGGVKSGAFFGDQSWHCWDDKGQNTLCID